MYSPIKANYIWRSTYNHELYKLCTELDVVKVIKVGWLRWLGQLSRMQEQNPRTKLTLHKPEGTRRVRRPVRWLDLVEQNLKTMGFRNWRRKSQDRDQGRGRFIMDCGARSSRRRRRRIVSMCFTLLTSWVLVLLWGIVMAWIAFRYQ
jgi:hypothetical protein